MYSCFFSVGLDELTGMHHPWRAMGTRISNFRGEWACLSVVLSLSIAACTSHDDDDGSGHLPAVARTPGEGGGGDGGAASSSSSSSSSSSGGQPGAIPPEACRFENDIAFDLPSGFATDQLDDLSGDDSGSCVEGELSHALRDMDGEPLRFGFVDFLPIGLLSFAVILAVAIAYALWALGNG